MSFLNEVIFQHTLWVCRVHAHVIIWYRCLLSSTGTHIPDEYHLYCSVISICLLIVNTDWFLMSWVRCWRSFQKLTMQQHAQSNASSQQHCQKAKMAETKYVQRNVYKDMELCIACMGDAQDITPRPGHLKCCTLLKVLYPENTDHHHYQSFALDPNSSVLLNSRVSHIWIREPQLSNTAEFPLGCQ